MLRPYKIPTSDTSLYPMAYQINAGTDKIPRQPVMDRKLRI